VTRPARLGERLMGFSMMSTWLLALPVLLMTLVGRVDLAVTLLSDLVGVVRRLLPDGPCVLLGRLAGTLVGPVGSRDGGKFAVHDMLLVRISVGGMILVLFSLNRLSIEAALARMPRLVPVGYHHVLGQHVRVQIRHCARSVSLAFGAGADVLAICVWH